MELQLPAGPPFFGLDINVPAFGELDRGLYSACCSNGLGSINGTLAGKFIIDKLCQSNDQTYLSFENTEKPRLLPPNFLTQMGANINHGKANFSTPSKFKR